MKNVEAIIKPHKLSSVSLTLHYEGVTGVTVTECVAGGTENCVRSYLALVSRFWISSHMLGSRSSLPTTMCRQLRRQYDRPPTSGYPAMD